MPLELTRPIVFFDIESTGVDPQTDRIVELAAIKIWPDGRREEKSRRFNPLVPIPKEASAIHGIHDEDVKDEPPFYKVAGGEHGVAAFFAHCDLAGYNLISFDIPILMAELARANADLDMAEVAVVDAFRVFTSRERRDLSSALKFYCDKELRDAHSALADIRATVEVLEGQLARYDDLPRTPAGIDTDVRHPEAIDREGKLRWQNGEAALSFGKHKGRTLAYLARNEPDYLRWMIENEVAPDASQILSDALLGDLPRPPETNTADEND